MEGKGKRTMVIGREEEEGRDEREGRGRGEDNGHSNGIIKAGEGNPMLLGISTLWRF